MSSLSHIIKLWKKWQEKPNGYLPPPILTTICCHRIQIPRKAANLQTHTFVIWTNRCQHIWAVVMANAEMVVVTSRMWVDSKGFFISLFMHSRSQWPSSRYMKQDIQWKGNGTKSSFHLRVAWAIDDSACILLNSVGPLEHWGWVGSCCSPQSHLSHLQSC